jgi:N-formylmaleamate deformylase
MGAATTLVLAARYPQLPRAIALEDPPPWWDPAYARPNNPEWQAMMRAWLVPLKQQSRQALLEAQRVAEPGWSEAELAPWVDSKLHFSLNFFDDLSDPGLDWSAIVRQVQCPALLITGDVAAGALVSEQAALLFQQLMPQVQIARIAKAGHSIRRDQFMLYMQAVQPFLAKMNARA